MELAYKFVSWEVPTLDSLKDSFEYRATKKLHEGVRLTRSEKDQIYRILYGNGRFIASMPLQGWAFDISPYLKKYAVEYKDGSMAKRFAPDKTSIRNHEPYIAQIHEL